MKVNPNPKPKPDPNPKPNPKPDPSISTKGVLKEDLVHLLAVLNLEPLPLGQMLALYEEMSAGGNHVPYHVLWKEVFQGIWKSQRIEKDLAMEISRMFDIMDEKGHGFIDVSTMGTVVSHILHVRASHYEWTLLFGVQGAIKREKELALVQKRTKEKMEAEGLKTEDDMTLLMSTEEEAPVYQSHLTVGNLGQKKDEIEISMVARNFARMIIDIRKLKVQSDEARRQKKDHIN